LEFLPLEATNWITCGNALRLDWLSICPPTGKAVKLRADDLFETPLDQAEIDFKNEGGETYICGNPPYLGGKKQNETQKQEMELVAGRRYSFKNLDYICAFIAKATDYMPNFSRVAFVSTSSVNQGIHVPNFWPFVLNQGVAISFSYEPFKWSNSASNNAGVYCTILGLARAPISGSRTIYFDGGKREVANINPYLIPGPDLIVKGQSYPISGLSKINTGNQAADGGNLFFTDQEKQDIIKGYPEAKALIRRIAGTSEFFDSSIRWCLWVDTENLGVAQRIPIILERIGMVRKFRETAGDVAQTLIDKPHQFRYRNVPPQFGMLVPQVSSESREYIPAGLFDRNLIITHKAHAIFEPDLVDFSVFNSRLHFTWSKTLSGRLGNGLSYSSNLSWNTFPVPTLTEQNKADLTRCAEDILLAREAHFPATIADLYDPDEMPANLRAAHERNDETLERIYLGRRFKNDTERLETLFSLYTQMTSTGTTAPPSKPAPRRKKADAA